MTIANRFLWDKGQIKITWPNGKAIEPEPEPPPEDDEEEAA